MNDIFGVPTSAIMITLLLSLAVCVLSVVWVAVRRPVIFKLGVRNIPRRSHQTAVVVLGLMLSTLIMASALGIGDTVDHSITGEVYDNLGSIDELVVASQDASANVDLASEGAFPATVFDTLDTAVADESVIDGLLPQLDARAAIVNASSQLAEPNIIVSGVDPSRIDAFGGLKATDGSTLDLGALAPNELILSAALATDLGAAPGDEVTIYHNDTPSTWTVAGIARDSYLSGTRRSDASGLKTTGLVMPLASAQKLTAQPGMLSAIAVSNAGDVETGMERTDDVVPVLDAALAGQGVGVDPVKQDRVDASEAFSAVFTGVFLILGLFSIAAGVLLIVLIFTMLAAERRSEMGMERAVGAQRRQLIQQFVSEGSGYAIVAGVVGSALGVAAAIGIAWGMQQIFGEYASIESHITPRSVVIAYAAGVVITFATVVLASWKVSRINIVAAVRDIPDASAHHRNKRTLAWGVVLLLAGGLLTVSGMGGAAFPFMSGMSLWPFGLALILGFFGVPGRPLYTVIGIALLVFWLLPEDAFAAIFGNYDLGFAMFFVSGIALVVATTVLVVNNLDLMLAGLSHVSRLSRPMMPAMRTAIAYPAAARGRTGMTIAMFSLIVFSLVMMATMNTNYAAGVLGDEANAGWQVRADQIGDAPIADFTGELEAKGVDTSGFEAVGVTHSPSTSVASARVTGAEDTGWKLYPVVGMEPSFIDESTLRFAQRASGYESDEAILNALLTEPNVVVVDALAIPQDGNFGADEDAFVLTGLKSEDKVFDPITVDLLSPADGSTHQVKVIGVIDSKIGSLYGMFGNQSTMNGVYGHIASTSYYVALRNPGQAASTAREIEAALLSDGVQGTSIRDELRDAQAQESGFLYIIEGFMGLGLLVGIAAVGVIAFRSVVERRQQIGVMRALGFQRRTVVLSFLIETVFVVGVGGFAGTVLGLLLSQKLLTSEDSGLSGTQFIVPWVILIAIALLTNAAALVMTWLPAMQAGRIAPAEALRYE